MDHLVGIPYVEGGRAVEGADCWGTIRLYFKMRGIDLPSYDGPTIPANHHALVEARAGNGPWEKVETPQVGDLGLWKRGRDLHAGVLVRPNMVLHNDSKGRGSALERVGNVVGAGPEWWRYRG